MNWNYVALGGSTLLYVLNVVSGSLFGAFMSAILIGYYIYRLREKRK